MSELPISSKYRSRPNDPVSDDEREELSRRINAAYTEGTLDPDDYRQRLDRLFAASSMGELVPVVEGLPPAQTYEQPAMVVQTTGAPGQVSTSRSGTRAAAVAVGTVSAVVLVIVILLIVLL